MDLKTAEESIRMIQQWYLAEIKEAAKKCGGLEKLSLSLGYTPKYLFRVLQRGSFSALRRVITKIKYTADHDKKIHKF